MGRTKRKPVMAIMAYKMAQRKLQKKLDKKREQARPKPRSPSISPVRSVSVESEDQSFIRYRERRKAIPSIETRNGTNRANAQMGMESSPEGPNLVVSEHEERPLAANVGVQNDDNRGEVDEGYESEDEGYESYESEDSEVDEDDLKDEDFVPKERCYERGEHVMVRRSRVK